MQPPSSVSLSPAQRSVAQILDRELLRGGVHADALRFLMDARASASDQSTSLGSRIVFDRNSDCSASTCAAADGFMWCTDARSEWVLCYEGDQRIHKAILERDRAAGVIIYQRNSGSPCRFPVEVDGVVYTDSCVQYLDDFWCVNGSNQWEQCDL